MSNHQREYRNALGAFATGVTVVTTIAEDDRPVGVTVNSFASVSLEPPLVLWSLAREAESFSDFQDAEHFVIQVLTRDQEALSNRFATTGHDKFEGIAWSRTERGLPLLAESGPRFHCQTEAVYPGGDHLIFVGRVMRFDARALAEPLIYFGGDYRALQPEKDGD